MNAVNDDAASDDGQEKKRSFMSKFLGVRVRAPFFLFLVTTRRSIGRMFLQINYRRNRRINLMKMSIVRRIS